MSPSRRSAELDFLRFIAVSLVLVRHLAPLPQDTPEWLRAALAPASKMGWIGVDLFFVLSGFLISGLLFREFLQYGRIDLKTFLIRRGLKIYPGFYLLITATIAAGVVQGWHVPWKKLMREVFFFQNYATGLWSHTWSLAVEEHFYLTLPILLLVLIRRSPHNSNPFRSLPACFIGVAVALLAARFLTAWASSFTARDEDELCHKHLFPTHLRIDSLFFGVVLSYFHHFHAAALRDWVSRYRTLLVAIVPVTVAPLCFFELDQAPFLYIGGFTGVYLGMGALLLVCMARGLPDTPIIRAGAFLGSHSYSIYLWHLAVAMLVSQILAHKLHCPWWILMGAYVGGAFVTGIVLGRLVEIPVLKLRDRVFPSRSQPLAELKPGDQEPRQTVLRSWQPGENSD